MSNRNKVALLLLKLHFFIIASAEPLTLKQAEISAFKQSYLAKASQYQAQSLQDQGLLHSQYDDPMLSFGVFNLPTDDFSINQHGSTQVRLGIKQKLPKGASLRLSKSKFQILSILEEWQYQDIRLLTLLKTRKTFLSLLGEIKKQKLLQENKKNFKELIQVTENKFANGYASQQDVIQSKLELTTIDNQILTVKNNIKQKRNQLASYIEKKAWSDIDNEFPEYQMQLTDDFNDFLLRHPQIKIINHQIQAAETELQIQQESSKPSWLFGFEYRKRFGNEVNGRDREDMLALTASIDLPSFNKKKYKSKNASALNQINALEQLKLEKLRSLKTKYNSIKDQLSFIAEKLSFYQSSIIKHARDNKQAALLAYQNNKADFSALIQAQIKVLTTETEILDLQVQQLTQLAELKYLVEPINDDLKDNLMLGETK